MTETPILDNYLYTLSATLSRFPPILEIKNVDSVSIVPYNSVNYNAVLATGSLIVDSQQANDGTFNKPNSRSVTGEGLVFGENSGEGIASKRTSGGNQYGLDFYTNYTRRLSIDLNGNLYGQDSSAGAISMTGGLAIDQQGANQGTFNNGSATGNGLQFGGGASGEGIASQRTSASVQRSPTTQYGLDFYTFSQPRLSIDGPTGNIIVHGGDIQLSNSDCAEDFDVSEDDVEPGTVMVLNEEGILEPSQHAYDKKVAGVIAGAAMCKPAIVLGKQQSKHHRKPLTLVGKVYCKVDAESSRIQIGDLLTTSSTAGHAMKATDPFRAFGAVIGKAMGHIEKG